MTILAKQETVKITECRKEISKVLIKMKFMDKQLLLYQIAVIITQYPLVSLKSTLLMISCLIGYIIMNPLIIRKKIQITINLQDFSTNKTFILISRKSRKTEITMNLRTSIKTIKITIKITILLKTKKDISIIMRQNTRKKAKTITTVSEVTKTQAMRQECTISLFIQKTEKSENIQIIKMNLMMAIIMNNIFKKQMSLQMVLVVIIVTMAEKPILKTLFIEITQSKSFK